MYNTLRFFKGFDYDLNMVKNSSDIWEGNVYLDSVSSGLYETVNLFLLEEVLYNSRIGLVKPFENSQGSTLLCKWIDSLDSSKDIIMYDAELKNGQPLVTYKKELAFKPQLLNDVPFTLDGDLKVYEKADFKTLSNEALQINITLNSNISGPHRRVLGIYNVSNGELIQVAQIVFYGEVVAEDERLKVLLQNLGATLDEGDFLLFKEHDISEQKADYILLNRKRKELLLELHNIKPFIGTYKAILNAIDFFGYTNLTLKEYWVNISNNTSSFGKLYAVPVPKSTVRGDMVRKKLTVDIPSSTMKKTSRFSLVYRLNKPNDGIDQWGIPTVDTVFDLTPPEILIKLYGLKQKLQREYLPLNAKIIDITAEGDFFTQKQIKTWNIQNEIAFFNEGHDIKFKVTPEGRTLFVEDMALVLGSVLKTTDDKYQTYIDLKPADYANLTKDEIEELVDIFNEFYADYNKRDLKTFNEDIEVACPIILNGTDSFKDTWNDAKFTWQDEVAISPNKNIQIYSGVTWDNWWKGNVYEVEWLVTGPRDFYIEIKGDIDKYLTMPLILPYEGGYNVEMRTYDLFGHRSYERVKNLFQVHLKEIELYGIYRWLDSTSWNDKLLVWDKTGGYWNNAQDSDVLINDAIASLYLTLDRANYVHDERQGIRFSTVRRFIDPFSKTGFSETKGPYQWDECRFRWRDAEHNWWDATRVGNDLAASFKVYNIENGDEIKISFKEPKTGFIITSSYVINSPTPISAVNTIEYENEWNLIKDELNSSTDPIISKFNWNPVFEDTDNDGIANKLLYILAVGKEYSKNFDFESVTVVPNNESNVFIDSELHVVHYNPGFDDTKIFRDYAEVERSTHVTISTDITKMPGIKNPKWTILNKSNPKINDIYYDDMWLTYIFQDPGTYEITLEVEDTNNNHNFVKRNMINVK